MDILVLRFRSPDPNQKVVIIFYTIVYIVFESLLFYYCFRSLSEVCDRLNIIHDLNPVDWELLKCIRDLLAPFAAAVKRLEGELYTTISEVYPIIFSLKAELQKVCK